MRKLPLLSVLLLLTFAPHFLIADTADDNVVVEIHNVRDGRGHVLVALCTAGTFLTTHCPYQVSVPAHPGMVLAHVAGVPPGIYSVEAFHDDDDTKILGRSFFGLPNKGLGFSRNAKMHFGPPKFNDAAFAVNQPEVRVSLTLRYY